MTTARGIALVARRELRALATTPVLWVVLTLFLVVQGFSFWAVLQVLSDPRAPAPLGAVLRTHFGGTVLYWAFLFFVVASVTMRSIAEERAIGTWEPLLTTRLSLTAIVGGKWLGALGFYALLWAPTVLYAFALAAIAPPGSSLDPGPLVGAYVGVLVIGAAATAIGVAASAGAPGQLVAATLTFVGLLAVLLAGAAPDLAPGFFARHETWRAAAEALDLRRTMDDAARGVIDLGRLGPALAVCAAALVVAGQLAGATRRTRIDAARGRLGAGLAVVCALLAAVLCARHPVRIDLTRARIATPDPAARALVRGLVRPVRVTVVPGQAPGPRAAWPEIEVALRALLEGIPEVVVTRVDPLIEPERAEALALAHELEPDALVAEGAILIEGGGDEPRREALELGALLEESPDTPLGAGAEPPGLRVDAAVAPALARVGAGTATRVCLTRGHDEPPVEPAADGEDLAALARALGRAGLMVRAIDPIDAGVPASCDVLAIIGARRPLGGAEARELDAWLRRGGRLLVAVDAPEPGTRAGGLETVLAGFGVRLLPAVAVDPVFEVGAPLVWGTTAGYGDHAIVRGLAGRLTIWRAPRALAVDDGTVLVTTSPSGWGETSLASLSQLPDAPDDADLPGPVAVAVAVAHDRTRIVVLGSAHALATVADDGRSDTLGLAAAAARWLGGTEALAIPARRPDRMTLALTREQLGRLFFALVLLGPGAAGAAGAGWLAWRRRR